MKIKKENYDKAPFNVRHCMIKANPKLATRDNYDEAQTSELRITMRAVNLEL